MATETSTFTSTPKSRWQFSLKKLLLLVLVLSPLFAIVGSEVQAPRRLFLSGKSHAEYDWSQKEAVIIVNWPISYDHKGVWLTHYCDPDSGLPLKRGSTSTEHDPYREGYNTTIRELLDSEGIPTWSAKKFLVSDQELWNALKSKGGTLIEQFPHKISDNCVLIRRGSYSLWGKTVTNSFDGMAIVTPHAFERADIDIHPVTIQRSKRLPEIIFIDSGYNKVDAFHEDGRHIASAFNG